MKPIHSLAVLPMILLASCGAGSDKDKSTASSSPAHVPFSQRIGAGGGKDPNSYRQDGNGKLYLKDAKRSPYEGKTDQNFGGKSFATKEYKTGDYAKKSWWGSKEYDRKAYAGNTDGSRFKTTSDLQGKGAREATTQADIPENYKTGTYATGDAREASASPIKKGTNDAIENRRETFEQPEVIGWKERRNLSVDQAKGILGN